MQERREQKSRLLKHDRINRIATDMGDYYLDKRY